MGHIMAGDVFGWGVATRHSNTAARSVCQYHSFHTNAPPQITVCMHALMPRGPRGSCAAGEEKGGQCMHARHSLPNAHLLHGLLHAVLGLGGLRKVVGNKV